MLFDATVSSTARKLLTGRCMRIVTVLLCDTLSRSLPTALVDTVLQSVVYVRPFVFTLAFHL